MSEVGVKADSKAKASRSIDADQNAPKNIFMHDCLNFMAPPNISHALVRSRHDLTSAASDGH
jgi:hypothetical protein